MITLLNNIKWKIYFCCCLALAVLMIGLIAIEAYTVGIWAQRIAEQNYHRIHGEIPTGMSLKTYRNGSWKLEEN